MWKDRRLEGQKLGSPEVQKYRRVEVQKFRSPEVQSYA
jgi:hypothetical protein